MANMKIIITYCSGPKNKEGTLLPAVDLYRSERIRHLYQSRLNSRNEFRILSGKFGLLEPEKLIPWYDHLLASAEVPKLALQVAQVLVELKADAVEYHTADPAQHPDLVPYFELVKTACGKENIPLKVVLLKGNPD